MFLQSTSSPEASNSFVMMDGSDINVSLSYWTICAIKRNDRCWNYLKNLM